MQSVIDGVMIVDLNIITTDGGAVMHGLKHSDSAYTGFGEAYFSKVGFGKIRGWKRHLKMTSNLIVPFGQMRFVFIDDRPRSPTEGKQMDIQLSSEENYQRLTIPPGIWTAFQGLGRPSTLLLNLANIEHDPNEVEQRPIEYFHVDWG